MINTKDLITLLGSYLGYKFHVGLLVQMMLHTRTNLDTESIHNLVAATFPSPADIHSVPMSPFANLQSRCGSTSAMWHDIVLTMRRLDEETLKDTSY
jgi:hypothetical protein